MAIFTGCGDSLNGTTWPLQRPGSAPALPAQHHVISQRPWLAFCDINSDARPEDWPNLVFRRAWSADGDSHGL